MVKMNLCDMDGGIEDLRLQYFVYVVSERKSELEKYRLTANKGKFLKAEKIPKKIFEATEIHDIKKISVETARCLL